MVRSLFKTLVFFSIIGLLAASFFYSRQIYRFYLTAYYKTWRKITHEDVAAKSRLLLEAKDHAKLDGYLRDILIVYPRDLDMVRIAGHAYIKMGKKAEGADLIVASLEGADLTRDELVGVIDELMKQGYYGDIVGIRNMGLGRNDAGMHFIYGKALFKVQNYDEARKELQQARDRGMEDVEVLYYLGLVNDRLGNVKEAVVLLEGAKKLSSRDPEVNNALIEVYRKSGQYDKAAELTKTRRMR